MAACTRSASKAQCALRHTTPLGGIALYDSPLIIGGATIAPVVLGARFTNFGERILVVTGLDPLALILIAAGSLAFGMLLLRLRPVK